MRLKTGGGVAIRHGMTRGNKMAFVLIVQPGSLCRRWPMFEVASAAVVAGLGAGLVASAPSGPGQPVADGVDGVGDQFGGQVADFLDSQRDQRFVLGAGALAVPGGHPSEGGVGYDSQPWGSR